MKRMKKDISCISFELYMNKEDYRKLNKEVNYFIDQLYPRLIDCYGSSGPAQKLKRVGNKESRRIIKQKFRMVRMVLDWNDKDFKHFEKKFYDTKKKCEMKNS